MSYSYTSSETFTLTHAKYIASKMAADLTRFQNFYGKPDDALIAKYELELALLLKHGYVETVTYGFKRDEKWVEALKYHVLSDGTLASDDDPGSIRKKTGVSDLSFTSFLAYTSSWFSLSAEDKASFKNSLPFQRTTGDEPGIEGGYWHEDKLYGSGGRSMSRKSIRKI